MNAKAKRPSERLTGSVERVTFHNAESGFCVLRVKVKGRREPVTVVGTLPDVRAGEWLDAEGAWRFDATHGRQFRAETLRTAAPSTIGGIERYLASGLVEGNRIFDNRVGVSMSSNGGEVIGNTIYSGSTGIHGQFSAAHFSAM